MGVKVSALPTDCRAQCQEGSATVTDSRSHSHRQSSEWASSACEIISPAYPLWTVENPGFPMSFVFSYDRYHVVPWFLSLFQPSMKSTPP